jgi:hypothetical protein
MKKPAFGERRLKSAPIKEIEASEQAARPRHGAYQMGIARSSANKKGRRCIKAAGLKDISQRAAPPTKDPIRGAGKALAAQGKSLKRRAGSSPAKTARGRAADATADAGRARTQMLQRLAQLRELVWRQFRHAPLKAIDRALKIEEREAALLGLDFLRRHQVVTCDAVEKIPIAALRERLFRALLDAPSAPAQKAAPGFEPAMPAILSTRPVPVPSQAEATARGPSTALAGPPRSG